MATNISNLQVVELAQKAINSFNGFQDSTKPFAKAFDGSVYYGNGVNVPVITPGVASNSLSFATDDSNTIAFNTVLVNTIAKNQIAVPNYQYEQLGQYLSSVIDSLVSTVSMQVSTAAYSLLTSANFTTTVAGTGWSESAPTLPALYKFVEKAKATGKINPNNVVVVMPSSTYAGAKSVLDALPREASLGFTLVPTYNANLTSTWITDGSAIGLGIGGDAGVKSGVEEFEFFTSTDAQIGYGLHIIPDAINQKFIVGLRTIFGTKVLNTTGAIYAAS